VFQGHAEGGQEEVTNPTTLLDDLISVQEAARLLGVHADTVRDWGAQQFFPMFRIGKRRLRMKRADIEAFAAAGAERLHTYKPRGYPRSARPAGAREMR
jgi:excisionase family DNA binding protein